MLPTRYALLLALSLTGPGCYAYVPSSPLEVSPGQAVRLSLSAAEAARYQDLRLANPRILEGTLVERTGESLTLEATVGANDASRGTRALVQLVTVPNQGILGVDLKELNKARTGLLIGGGGAIILAAVLKSRAGSGSDDPGGVDIPEARRVPLLRFDFPVGRR